MYLKHRLLLLVALICAQPYGQLAHANEDESNPLLDMASMFFQEALSGQNGAAGGNGGGAGAGLAGMASLLGTFMQANGKSGGGAGGNGAMQILSGLGSLLANSARGNDAAGGGGGFDPSIIGNVLEMFTQSDDEETAQSSDQKRSNGAGSTEGAGIGLDTILQVASAFMNTQGAGDNSASSSNHHQQKRSADKDQADTDNGLMNLLPLVMQAVSSFAGPEGQSTQERHKSHAWVLPPFLEHIHVLWDHFSNSELADALYEKSGVNKIMKGFKSSDGKLDYDKLFESLNNQSFRRRWIKSATLYLADWASYLANPDVYLRYFQTAQIMFNGLLKSQGYPKQTHFDPSHPSETISNLMDHVAKHHLNVKIDSRQYVKPAVGYAKELLKLGQARGLLQFNATEISDKLTDTLNLEVIEPVLKVHRAYRYISKTPQCDRYVLCQLNAAALEQQKKQEQPSEKAKQQSASGSTSALIAGVSPKIVKIGSMGAAIFISTETGTPFWTLFGVINAPYNCEAKYPVDCNGFHEGEAKVTTEYIHNEL
ncbi:uncharacterized protein Dwil_GK22429 [Drosophila willistoni]|uniref:Uncharacterized protein n=1 Tax=Drosophila willistoni TaxID=7260 RepID=B4NG19_DROWI|nr:uncharacterized protein LOC6649899 [Drosophila willistoni]EDW83236.1 uncharacterized protein Dwil_GK22429 [Drosophila willistoni]